MPEVVGRLMPRSYAILPRNTMEASYGKACLLTDTMIAVMLDLLQGAQAQTEEGREAIDVLWNKLLDLWNEEAVCLR